MNEAPHLRLAMSLFTLTLQDVSDQIVSESWKTADAIVRAHESDALVSIAIEVAAFLLHALSRSLPLLDGDYLNGYVFSPVVHRCCAGMGDFVERLQDAGAFSIAVFCGDDVEAEALSTVDSQEKIYSTFPQLAPNPMHSQENVISYASFEIGRLVSQEHPETVGATAMISLLRALKALDFEKTSAHLQAGLTLELIKHFRTLEV